MERNIRLVPDSNESDPLAQLMARVDRLEDAALAAGTLPLAEDDRSSKAPTPSEAPDDPLWMVSGLAERYPADAVIGYVGRIPEAATETEMQTETDAPAGYRGPSPVSWQYGRGVGHVLASDWDDHQVASRLAALGNPTRLRLAQEILRGHDTVASLGEIDGVGTAGQVYHHLSLLQAAGWVRQVARGRYGVPPERVVPLLVIVLATQGAS